MTETRSLGVRLRAIVGHRAVWPLLALAVILIIDGFISPGFFTVRIVQGRLFGSVIDILYRAVPPALLALGMAVVIGTKGIDLSVGSVIAVVGATIAWRIHAGDPHFVILLIALGVGLLCGVWNGFLVAVLDIQPIIATLILMVSGRGIGLMINLIYGGTNPSFESPLLQGLSVGHIGLIPTRLILGAAISSALWLLIRRTALGLFLESVGGNAAAANLAGINARLIKYSAYLISGDVRRLGRHHSDRRHAHLRSGQRRAVQRARRHPGGGDRRRFAGRRTHLPRHDAHRRAHHPGADDLDPDERAAARIQPAGQGRRGALRAAPAVEQLSQRRGLAVPPGESMRERYLPLVATIIVFLALFITGGLLYKHFFSTLVLGHILADNAFIIIAAIGTTFVILSGGIDLSIGSMIGFVGVVMASLDTLGWHPLESAALMLAFGVMFGAFQGFIIDFCEIQPFIITLAGLFMLRGACFMVTLDAIPIRHPFVWRSPGPTFICRPAGSSRVPPSSCLWCWRSPS